MFLFPRKNMHFNASWILMIKNTFYLVKNYFGEYISVVGMTASNSIRILCNVSNA